MKEKECEMCGCNRRIMLKAKVEFDNEVDPPAQGLPAPNVDPVTLAGLGLNTPEP